MSAPYPQYGTQQSQPYYPPQQYSAPQQPPGYGYYQGPPKPVSFIARPKVIAGVVLGIIGGIMLLIGVFISFFTGCGNFSGYTVCFGMSLTTAGMPAELLYGYIIPVAGILVLVFALVAPFGKKKAFGTTTFVFGLLGMIIAIVLYVHAFVRIGAMYTGLSVLPGIGFFLAVIGGVLGLVAGIMHSKEIARMSPAPTGPQATITTAQYGQPSMPYPPPYPQPQPPQYASQQPPYVP